MDWLTFVWRIVGSLAWPLVALVAVVLFREPLRRGLPGLSKRLTEFSGPGFAAKFREESKEAVDDVATAGGRLASVTATRSTTWDTLGTVTAAPQPTDIRTGSLGPEATGTSMDDIEAIIEAAARWGWVQAQSKRYSGFPTPIIDWIDSRPFIMSAKVMNPGDTFFDTRRNRSKTITASDSPGLLDPPRDPIE